MKTRMMAAAILAATGTLILAGCGSDNGMMTRDTAIVMRTIPASGDEAFDPSAAMHISFSRSMDSIDFNEKFTCIDAMSHDAMHDSLDQGMMGDSVIACGSSGGGMMGGGMMGGGMMGGGMMGGGMRGGGGRQSDFATFYRRMHDRGVAGTFQWNATLDSCEFHPNSPLMNGREYVMMIRSMRLQSDRGEDGMMASDGRDMMVRFRTR